MARSLLKKANDIDGAGAARVCCDEWADSYDVELRENGYATPRRCAKALAGFIDDLSAPVLDFGCGTGLSGTALAEAGFRTVDGVDLSEDMLKGAAEKQVYRKLRRIRPGENPIPKRGDYAAISAIGVIGAGAAPISTFDVLMKGLPRGGKIVLSFNDHTLDDPASEARLCEWLDCGAARLLYRKYGDHLPELGLKSYVYVIERT